MYARGNWTFNAGGSPKIAGLGSLAVPADDAIMSGAIATHVYHTHHCDCEVGLVGHPIQESSPKAVYCSVAAVLCVTAFQGVQRIR
jgi:hypothetical protein